MKRNDGFSLVELIVVIAILAILSTAAISGVGMLSGWRVNECVSLVDSSLKETRTEALAKRDIYFTLSVDGEGTYTTQVTGHPAETVSADNVTIAYKTDAQSEEIVLTESKPLILSYDSASGAFLPMFEVNGEGIYVKCQTGSGENVTSVYCTQIRIFMGDEKETIIKLIKSTGKHTVE